MPHDNPILNKAKVTNGSTNVTPVPVTSGTDKLQLVEESLATSIERTATAVLDLERGTKQTALATDVITSAIGDITSANRIIATTKNNANLQAQNATIAAFEATGGTEAQEALSKQLTQDSNRVTAILTEREELSNVDRFGEGIGLIDNIINQFNINLTEVQLRAAKAKQTQTVNQISNSTAATESFARVNALTRKTLNEGVIEANYKAIEAEGKIKAAEAEIKSLQSNATAMTNLMAADSRNNAALLQAYRLEGEDKEREIKKERIAFQREQMAVTRKQWEIQMPAATVALEQAKLNLERSQRLGPTQILKAEQELLASTKRFNDQVDTENALVGSVRRAQSLAGTPVEDKGTILFGLKQSGDTGKKYARLLDIGGTPDPILGFTPFEAKQSVDTIAPSGNITPTKGTRLLAQITSLQLDKYKKPGAKVPRDEATLQADFNTTAKEAITIAATDIATGDNSNPYHAPPFTVLEESDDLKLQPLYNKVLRAMQMKETNPQTIMDASIAAILAGTVTPEEAAAGITSVFELAALINSTQDGGFRRIGLPNQTTYNSKLTRPTTIFEELKVSAAPRRLFETVGLTPERKAAELFPNALVSVDLMDRTKVQQMIVQILSSGRASIEDKPTETATTDKGDN